jgi:hypothetical protein
VIACCWGWRDGHHPAPPDPCGPGQLLGLLEQLAAQLLQLEQAAAGLALGDQQQAQSRPRRLF